LFQKNEFKAALAREEITLTQLAESMKVSPVTLYRKANGISDFTREEITEIRNLLKLGDAETMSIFFR